MNLCLSLRGWNAWAVVVCVIGAICFLTVAVTVGEIRQRMLRDRGLAGKGEVIFPIGHYVVKGSPGPIYKDKDRLDAARALWVKEPRPIWLLGGGQSRLKESVASVGKRYLVAQGIPSTAIVTLDDFAQFQRSLDTTQEIEIASMLAKGKGVSTIVVVGEVLHLAQARLVFDSYGIDTLLVGTPETQYGLRYQLTRSGALLVTLFDRRGLSLFWLRWVREEHPNWPWKDS